MRRARVRSLRWSKLFAISQILFHLIRLLLIANSDAPIHCITRNRDRGRRSKKRNSCNRSKIDRANPSMNLMKTIDLFSIKPLSEQAQTHSGSHRQSSTISVSSGKEKAIQFQSFLLQSIYTLLYRCLASQVHNKQRITTNNRTLSMPNLTTMLLYRC